MHYLGVQLEPPNRPILGGPHAGSNELDRTDFFIKFLSLHCNWKWFSLYPTLVSLSLVTLAAWSLHPSPLAN